jgi:hypothetical protein
MHFDGHGFVYNGMLTVTQADWEDLSQPRRAFFMLQVGDFSRGLFYELIFESQLLNFDLIPGVYEMAERAVVGSPGHPGIDISSEGRACAEPTGRFQIHQIELQPDGKFDRVLFSFEQHCLEEPPLTGCLRFER